MRLEYDSDEGFYVDTDKVVMEEGESLYEEVVLPDDVNSELDHRQAEIKRLRAKIDRQRDRIVYLEGATNHATGTPLTKARDRADRAEARLRAVVEVVDRHQHWTDQTTVTQLIDAADYERCKRCGGDGGVYRDPDPALGCMTCPDCGGLGWRPRGEDDG